MHRLSDRLETLLALCRKGERGADVGCDHGYVSIRLVRDGIFRSMLAMDLREGPLQAARDHIREEGLEDRIECRLSDGLEALEAGEADALICAGMGGDLMCRILDVGMDKLRQMKQLVLQPQSEISEFRRFLRKNGFRIEAEELVLEDGKYYPMMRAANGVETYDDEDACAPLYDAYGRLLLQGRHPLLKSFLERESVIAAGVRERLLESPKRDGERLQARLAEVDAELERIGRAQRFFEEGEA